jgi:hypothetical protein
MDIDWTNADSAPPTVQTRQWRQYLTEDALPLIRTNEGDPQHGELLLEIPNAKKM